MKLGVNIDHVATLRQLRATPYPSVLEAAEICARAGAEQITVHLREDRRHIQDEDVRLLRRKLKIALNLEMAVAEPIVKMALKLQPDWACLVPEKRQELTTEGGLNVRSQAVKVKSVVARLKRVGIRVSLFVEPDIRTVRLSAEIGADAVELHTGRYAGLTQARKVNEKAIKRELERIYAAAVAGREAGIHVHAGHGLDAQNVQALAALVDSQGQEMIEEYNIGHYLVCRSVEVGLFRAVQEMRSAILAP